MACAVSHSSQIQYPDTNDLALDVAFFREAFSRFQVYSDDVEASAETHGPNRLDFVGRCVDSRKIDSHSDRQVTIAVELFDHSGDIEGCKASLAEYSSGKMQDGRGILRVHWGASSLVTSATDVFAYFVVYGSLSLGECKQAVVGASVSGLPHSIMNVSSRLEMKGGLESIRLANFLSGNSLKFFQSVLSVVSERIGIDVVIDESIPYDPFEVMNGDGCHGAFVCGLMVARWPEETRSKVHPIASPVVAHERSNGAPVYFADLVHRNSTKGNEYVSLESHRGKVFAYNEQKSYSGYVAFERRLQELFGEGIDEFVGSRIYSGSHVESMSMVARGDADFASIDSFVLHMEKFDRTSHAHQLGVAHSFGPAPMPPLVLHETVPRWIRDRICHEFTTLHQHDRGREVLVSYGISKWVRVTKKYYEKLL